MLTCNRGLRGLHHRYCTRPRELALLLVAALMIQALQPPTGGAFALHSLRMSRDGSLKLGGATDEVPVELSKLSQAWGCPHGIGFSSCQTLATLDNCDPFADRSRAHGMNVRSVDRSS